MANLIKPRYLLKLLHFNADRDRCNRTVDGKQNDVPSNVFINPLNAEINPIYHLLALLGAHPILHISGVSVKTDNRCTTASVNMREGRNESGSMTYCDLH